MTEQDFLKLISTESARSVLKALSKITPKDRRTFAKPAMALFRKVDRYWVGGTDTAKPEVTAKDGEAVTIAVFATASASELKKMSFFPHTSKVSLEEIVRDLKPEWVQPVVEHFVERQVFLVKTFQPLWEAGLCERPDSDALILNYYSIWGGVSAADEKNLLAGDVWRFFKVEGGGEDSLANHDKFCKQGTESWANRLKRYADEGKLDRQRLLDASLDALDRDFGQYRAGWYSRFHVLLAPDTDEMAARRARYLGLLASSVPPTVSFALKHVQSLDKARALDPEELLASLDPALQARAKATATGALRLLLSAAKQRPDLRQEAAAKAVLALISEDAAVQGKALDTIDALGVDAAATHLADYVALVAPSLRSRIATMAGVGMEADQPDMPAVESAPIQLIEPVTSAQDALGLFLSVLETPRDPFEVEKAIDGISRFGVELRADEKALSPLRKRARQVCKSPGDTDVRHVLALTGRALAEGVELSQILAEEGTGEADFRFVAPLSLQNVHLSRNGALLARLAAGHSLPLLSLPSDSSGTILADHLNSRLALYRGADVVPDPIDLALALMRLSPIQDIPEGLPTETEAERAFAYALGAPVAVGPTPELWAAAWCARQPAVRDEAVIALFPSPTPGCGLPIEMELAVDVRHSENGEYRWIDVEVPANPMNATRNSALPALFAIQSHKHFEDNCCGHTFADIAWASLARPADQEPFFRIGLIHQDSWQKLSDNPTRGYLEPFFRAGPPVGPLGAAILAYYMACEDKSVSSLAAEAVTTTAVEGRLSPKRLATALKPFLLSGALPITRWTKGLATVANLGAGQFAREVIVGVLDFTPDKAPRDIGGLLELCYELHVAQDANLSDPSAIGCLKAIPGGGKVARFGKKLLSLTA